MKLKDLHISGFGKYTHEDLSFTDGINVIYGDNGSGKSTLHAYLRAMLFGMERGRGRAASTDTYSHYYPWNSQAPYGGSLSFRTDEDDGDFLLERCFDTKNRTMAIRKQATGKLISTEQADLDRLLGGLTEDVYKNTISIEQLKAATDKSLSSGLKNHLSSLTFSGNSALDVTHTMASLKEKKKVLKQSIDPNAEERFRSLFREICEIEDQLKDMDGQPEELEKRIKTLEASLKKEQKTQAGLETLHELRKEQLAKNSMSAIRNPEIYQDRLEDAFAAHRLAKNENDRHARRRLRFRDIAAGLLSTVIFALLGLGIIFYDKIPIVNTPFPLPMLPFLIFFFGASGVSLLVTVILFILSRKDDSDSEAMAAETELFLQQQFELHLGTSEVSEEGMEELLRVIDDYFQQEKELEATERATEDSLKAIVALQKQLQAAHEEQTQFQKQTWEFEQATARLADLEEQKTAVGRIREANHQAEEKIKAVTLAEETIASLSAKIHETFSPVLNRQVSEILCSITDGIYDQVYIDESLNVTVRTGGRTVPLESLSRGTIEQIYLALRISAVQILCPDASFPILLDDTFAYYDDTRLHNTLKWLAEHYSGQVLLFTCHKREAAFLSRLNVPYHLITL